MEEGRSMREVPVSAMASMVVLLKTEVLEFPIAYPEAVNSQSPYCLLLTGT